MINPQVAEAIKKVPCLRRTTTIRDLDDIIGNGRAQMARITRRPSDSAEPITEKLTVLGVTEHDGRLVYRKNGTGQGGLKDQFGIGSTPLYLVMRYDPL